MAERHAIQKLEEQLQCTICLDTYADPKVLQCDHVYCRECLGQLLDCKRQGKLSLTCPSCRQVTPVPENGVQGLKSAFQTNNFLDIQSSLKRKAGKMSYCPTHVYEELKLYCETCKELICFNCAIKDARHHRCEYVKLTNVCDQYKNEIEESLEPMNLNLGAIEEALDAFEITRGDISSQEVVIEADIHSTINELHAILEDRRNKLVSQLHKFTKKKLERLATQCDHVTAMRDALRQCQVYVEVKLEAMSSQELVDAKASIVDHIEVTNSVFQPEILIPTTTADIRFTASTEATNVCQKYGILSAKEKLPDPSKCHATGSGLDTIMVGETATVVVEAIDYWGEPCVEPNQSIIGIIESEITGVLENVHMEVIKTGHYELNITPAIKGWHHLRIEVGGQGICGSPFTILVKSSQRVGTLISTIYDVHKPWRIVINHKRQIVVSEHDKHCVSVLGLDGMKIRSFGTLGSDDGQFNHPRGIAVDEKDNILVTDYQNNRIQKFTSDGEFLAAVGTKGNKALEFKGPNNIAFNTFNKKVYVVDENRVQILESDLSYCGEFEGRNPACGIECDRLGRVYLLSARKHQIQVFSADGTSQNVIGNFGVFTVLQDIAIDMDDNVLYVSESVKGRVFAFTLEGEVLDSFSTVLLSTAGIAVDSGVVYVCDYIRNSIKLF